MVLVTPVGRSTLVMEIPERPVSLLTDMGSFHFVRLAPHFGQDDSGEGERSRRRWQERLRERVVESHVSGARQPRSS